MRESQVKKEADRGFSAAVVLYVLACTVVLGALAATRFPLGDGDLIDTDSYTRAVRVIDLWKGGAWFNPVVERSNAPFGEQLHWTRPLDIFISAIAIVLIPFFGTEQAIYWATAATGPVTLILAGIAWLWAIRPVVPDIALPTAGLLLAAQPALLGYGVIGRGDHHLLLLGALAVSIGSLLRLIEGGESSRAPTTLGVSLAFGAWVGPEFVLFVLLLTAIAAALVVRGQIRSARLLRAGASATVASLFFLVVERGPGILTLESDRISMLHVGMFGIAWLVAAVLTAERIAGKRSRTGIAVTGGVLIVAFSAFAFPELRSGPGGAVPDSTRSLWLDNVTELASLIPTSIDSAVSAAAYLGLPLVAVVIAIHMLRSRKSDDAGLALGVVLVATLLLGFTAVRFAVYPEMVAAAVIAGPLWELRSRPSGRVKWLLAVVVLLLVPLVAAGRGPDSSSEAPVAAACDATALAVAISDLGATAIVLANLDAGPEILYRTDVNVVATPYHRNPGIEYWYQTMSAPTGLAQAMLDDRPVTHIAVCPSLDERWFGSIEGSLYRDLLADSVPWIMESGGNDTGVRVFALER